MLIGFFPIAFVFLASFLLTLRWYKQLGSLPALFLGAIAQPLFTALLFSTGITFVADWTQNSNGFNFERAFKSSLSISILFTVVIANPIALIISLPVAKSIKAMERKEYYDSSDGFEILMVVAIMSSLCAISSAFVVWFIVSRY